jgi:bisphosphoglycerate-dependent phosphoglycerate mutase
LDTKKPATEVEDPVAKMERLKGLIGARLQENRARLAPQSEFAAKAERLAGMLRSRLKEGQAEQSGRDAVMQWMRSDGK